MNKGFRAEVKIEKVVYGGAGLARLNGKVCFVPGTLDGETAIIEVVKEKPDYSKGRCLRITVPSPHRIEPECALSKICSGCVYQHTSYEYENQLKADQLDQFIKKSISVPENFLIETAAPQSAYGYRNKITLHVQKECGKTSVGYKLPDGNITPIRQCILGCDAINRKLDELLKDNSFYHTLHNGQSLVLRHTAQNNVIYWRNKPPAGISWLKENMPFGSFSVPAGCFQQVNSFGCSRLVEEVTNIITQTEPQRVIDLYCGSGLFATAAAAAGVKDIVAVEADEQAIAAARYNLKQHGISSPEIISGDVGKKQNLVLEKINAGTLLIVDPPRRGLHNKVKQMLGASKLQQLVYISCSPDTFSRDVKLLNASGFRLDKVLMLNMFPRTAHFETFSYLTR